MTYDYRDAVIDELRTALLLMMDAPYGGSQAIIARRQHAYNFAHAAWVQSATLDVKELVLRLAIARCRERTIELPFTYLDAVEMFGRSIVIEAEQALK